MGRVTCAGGGLSSTTIRYPPPSPSPLCVVPVCFSLHFISQRERFARHGQYSFADELYTRKVMAALRRRRVSDDELRTAAHDAHEACWFREGLVRCVARL